MSNYQQTPTRGIARTLPPPRGGCQLENFYGKQGCLPFPRYKSMTAVGAIGRLHTPICLITVRSPRYRIGRQVFPRCVPCARSICRCVSRAIRQSGIGADGDGGVRCAHLHPTGRGRMSGSCWCGGPCWCRDRVGRRVRARRWSAYGGGRRGSPTPARRRSAPGRWRSCRWR